MTRVPLLWLLHNDARLRANLRAALEPCGYELRLLIDLPTLQRRLARERPDLLLLANTEAFDDVLEGCLRLRDGGDDVPIIVLVDDNALEDRIRAFDAGADDCVAKSCDTRELIARIKSLLRRRHSPPSGAPVTDVDAVVFGECVLDFATRQLFRGQQRLALTSGEFALLAALVRNPHRSLTRERLIELARGPGSATTVRSIDVQVSRLRKLIEADPTRPRFLQTVWGHGYVFVPDTESPDTERPASATDITASSRV